MSARRGLVDWLLVAIALGLVVVWFALPRPTPRDPLDVADWSKLLGEPPSVITVHRGNARISLSLRQDGMTGAPFASTPTATTHRSRYTVPDSPEASTDPAAVDRLLRAFSHLEVLRPVDLPRGQLGLDPPLLEIQLLTRAGPCKISLGKSAPSPAGSRYATVVKQGQQQDVVIGPNLVELIDIEPDSLLDHRVVDWLPSELRRVELVAPTGPIVFERPASGRWMVATGTRGRARRSMVDGLLLALTEVSLTRLLEPRVAAAALGEAVALEVSLRASREQRELSVRLKLGGKCPLSKEELVLVMSGDRTRAGCVAPSVMGRLALDPGQLVDDAAFFLHADEVERLEVTGPAGSFTLERDAAQFRLKTDQERLVSLGAGNAVLDALVKVRGQVARRCNFEMPLSGGMLSLRSFVVGDDGPSSDRIRLDSTRSDGKRPICRDDGMELLLAPTEAAQLELEPALLRDPQLFDTPVESITQVQILGPSGRKWLRADKHGRFELVDPLRGPSEAASAETLREQLSHLRAERWLHRSMVVNVRARATTLSVEFVVQENVPSQPAEAKGDPSGTIEGGRGPGEPNRPRLHPRPGRHRLRLAIGNSASAVGWFDDEPTAFEVDTALLEAVLRFYPVR